MSFILSKIPVPHGKSNGNASNNQPTYKTAPKSRRPRALRDYLLKSLPASSGPYDVGSIDLEIPVEREEFGIIRNGEQVLVLETVLVTIFYPIKLGTSKTKAPDGGSNWSRQLWLSKDRSSMARGYGDFSGVNKTFCQLFFTGTVGLTKLPAWRNAPLAEHFPPEGNVRVCGEKVRDKEGENPYDRPPIFPMMVFSHGLGGTRTTYSAICGEFASYGWICCAIEHRDGSGPRTFVNYADERKARVVDYVGPEDGRNDTSNEEETDRDLRNAQLRMRKREVQEVHKIMVELNNGNGEEIAKQNLRIKPLPHGTGGSSRGTKGVEWAKWKDRMNTNEVIMCGHSFGGATAISVLKTPSMTKHFKYGILLDTWGQGVSPDPQEGEQEHVGTPILAMCSESFLYWEENLKLMFEFARDTAESNQKIWLFTIRGTFHLSFSDFGVLWPRIFKYAFRTRIEPERAIDVIVNSSLEFLKQVMPERVSRWNRGTDEKLLETPISDKWRYVRGKRNDWRSKMKLKGGDDREIWMHLTPDSGYSGIEGHKEGGTDATTS